MINKLKEYLHTLSRYERAIWEFSWDLQTGAPEKSADDKVESITFFSMKLYEMTTAPEYGAMLEALSEPAVFETLDEAMRYTVKTRLRDYRRTLSIPADFYEEQVRLEAASGRKWEEAKHNSDFSIFAPYLEKLIDMKIREMGYTDPDKDPYTALLGRYEEGIDTGTIDRLFSELKAGLAELLPRIMAKPEPDSSLFDGDYPIELQRQAGRKLLTYIGFDLTAGAMGESEHPFTMRVGGGDVRVTNHYHADRAIDAMFSIIHEGGHGLFEQGIDPAYADTDVENIPHMGLHESQSRFIENILGRNINFWKPVYADLQELLPPLRERSLDELNREINHIAPSMIRTEADEITYCLHIILRYEVEQAIFRDRVPVNDLPALWNEKTQELLGLTPANDAEGILQDMHWSDGSFGYFPSYLLGSIYDAMFLEALEQDLGSVDALLAEGRIGEIRAWLREKIHRFGGLYTGPEVVQRVCGKPLSARPLLDYFTRKYTAIYDL